MKPKKKRNPQDSTLRNIRALKKRVSKLEVEFFWMHPAILDLMTILDLMMRVKRLAKKNEK